MQVVLAQPRALTLVASINNNSNGTLKSSGGKYTKASCTSVCDGGPGKARIMPESPNHASMAPPVWESSPSAILKDHPGIVNSESQHISKSKEFHSGQIPHTNEPPTQGSNSDPYYTTTYARIGCINTLDSNDVMKSRANEAPRRWRCLMGCYRGSLSWGREAGLLYTTIFSVEIVI